MMSPLKLSVIVCGAAAGLAVAPYIVKQVLPPEPVGQLAAPTQPAVSEVVDLKLDLPVAGQNSITVASPPATVATPMTEEVQSQPELALAAPALPAPEKIEAVTLPSLANPQVASAALPVPSTKVSVPTPAPQPPKPSPTPEIPYRSDVETAQKLMKQLGMNTGKVDGKLGPNTQLALKEYQRKEGLDASGDVNPELIGQMEKAVAALATPTPAPTPEAKVEITETELDSGKSEEMAISKADDPDTLVVRKSGESEKSEPTAESKPSKNVADKPVKTVDPGPVPSLMNMNDVRKIQQQLKEVGAYQGEVDGKWGDLTRSAMREFQENSGLEATGKPNKETWLAMHNSKPIEAKSKSEMTLEIAKKPEPKSDESDDTSEDVLVTVNGDGTSKPGNAEPLATPAAVSVLDKEEKSDAGSNKSNKTETPKVTVSAPSRSKSDSKPDLAVAREDRESQKAELQKEIKATRAKIQSVSNDSTYEVKKYAPKMLEAVNTMADDLGNVNDDNEESTKDRLARISEELEKVKKESGKRKAESLVSEVKKSYQELKNTFPNRIKALSTTNESERKEREVLTDYVADIDRGFDAMETDFNKGKYDRIFENGVAFKETINEINRGLAEVYVRGKLSDKTVTAKLSKNQIENIEGLVEKSEHIKAAEQLDKVVSSGSKKKS